MHGILGIWITPRWDRNLEKISKPRTLILLGTFLRYVQFQWSLKTSFAQSTRIIKKYTHITRIESNSYISTAGCPQIYTKRIRQPISQKTEAETWSMSPWFLLSSKHSSCFCFLLHGAQIIPPMGGTYISWFQLIYFALAISSWQLVSLLAHSRGTANWFCWKSETAAG